MNITVVEKGIHYFKAFFLHWFGIHQSWGGKRLCFLKDKMNTTVWSSLSSAVASWRWLSTIQLQESIRDFKKSVSIDGNFTTQVCICVYVCVLDKEIRAGLHELMARLHLQIIIFPILYTNLLSRSLLKTLIWGQMRLKS